MAILSSMCFQFPDIPLQIIFLPFFTFSAGSVSWKELLYLLNYLFSDILFIFLFHFRYFSSKHIITIKSLLIQYVFFL